MMDAEKIKNQFKEAFLEQEHEYCWSYPVEMDLRVKCNGKAIYTRPTRFSYDGYAGDPRSRSVWELLKRPFTRKRYIHGSERIELDFKSIKVPITSYDQHGQLSQAFRGSGSQEELVQHEGFNRALESLGRIHSDLYDSIPGYEYSMPAAPWLFDHQVDLHVGEEGAWQKDIWSDSFIDAWIEEVIDENFVELSDDQQAWPQKKLIKWLQEQFPEAEKVPSKRGYKYFFKRTYLDERGEAFSDEIWDRIFWIDKPITGYARDGGGPYYMELQFRGLELDKNSVSFVLSNKKASFEDLKASYEFVDEHEDDVFLKEYTAMQAEAQPEEPKSFFKNVWLRVAVSFSSYVSLHAAMTWEQISPDLWLPLLIGVVVSSFLMKVFLPTVFFVLTLAGLIGVYDHLTEFEILSSIGNLIFALVALYIGIKCLIDK
jgi:hypothetical protein